MRMPGTSGPDIRNSGMSLSEKVGGGWRLVFQPSSNRYESTDNNQIIYPERKVREKQFWPMFPVFGISFGDAKAYAAYLARTAKPAGSRLCTEQEWERAARGADDREFPHGDSLAPEDANFDSTYGRMATTLGPDEVGSFTASRSPFDVDDMVGNVAEWVIGLNGTAVIASGSFYDAVATNSIVNRNTPEPTLRSVQVGVRICADVPW